MLAQSEHQKVCISGKSARVLLIEHGASSFQDAAASLRRSGAEVDCAEGIRQGERCLLKQAYAVVVIDIDTDESQLQRCLAAMGDAPHSTVFVLARSPSQAPYMLDGHGPYQNCLGVVDKPFHEQELVDFVRQGMTVAKQRNSLIPGAAAAVAVVDGPVLVIEPAALGDGPGAACRTLLAMGVRSQQCLHARSLAEAVEHTKSIRIEVALVSLELPDALGIDAVRRLHAHAPDLPLVALLQEDSDLSAQALWAGAQEAVRRDEHGETLVRAMFQALARKQTERQLRRLANHDMLTGLLNATSFNERLIQCLRRVKRENTACGLLYLDLNDFKPINDRLGHQTGDQVLRVVAARLEEATRSCDALARLGGDEFAVLLEDVYDRSSITRVTHRILDAIAAPIQVENGEEVRVTASIGIALCPQVGDVAERLLAAADGAMYEAKALGPSCYAFALEAPGSIPPAPSARLHVELREAIHRGQFFLMYQPQLEIQSRSVIGAEALLRWRRAGSDKQMIGPDKFVPVLEESGLILQVGAFVLREACRHARAWASRRERPLRVAVNVSPVQLEDAGFLDLVLGMLDEYQLEPSSLELEVTEGTLLRGDRACDTLARLRAHGLRIALDDFGTGYAALSYLRDFPLDMLKIDRSFIAPLLTDERSRILVASIIELARKLNMQVLAEGVETPEQLTYLRDRGCDACQGFLFGRPHFTGHLHSFLH